MTNDLFALTGRESDVGTVVALAACQEVVHAFYDLLDQGDLDTAFSLHAEDLAFYPPGSVSAVTRDVAAMDAARVRFAYEGRRTLHLATGFLGRRVAPNRVMAHYLMTVLELTEQTEDGARELEHPVVFAVAREYAQFRLDDGAWRYVEQRLEPLITKRWSE